MNINQFFSKILVLNYDESRKKYIIEHGTKSNYIKLTYERLVH